MSLSLFYDETILCSIIESIEEVHDFILSLIDGEEQAYMSSDTLSQLDEDQKNQDQRFTSEFLNDIKC